MYEADVNDFALTKGLEVVAILKLNGSNALCRYSYDYDEKATVLLPRRDLIKLTHKSGKLALKKLGERIGKLSFKVHEIEDCMNYLENEDG